MSALRPGYKQTEVGVIPEDWEPIRLAVAASRSPNAIVGGPFGSDLVSTDYITTGVPVIRGQNMGKKYVDGDFVFVSQEKAKHLVANCASPSDLVFTQRGTLGQVAICPPRKFVKYLISQSQMKISLDLVRYVTEYFYYYFSSSIGQKQITDSAIQTGVPHTNLGILRDYKLPVPSKRSEQQAIAEALGDADALIEALEALIAKKRDIKQGAMQDLLTGHRRLPGFQGEWTNARIVELADVDGDNIGSEIPGSYAFRYISLEDVDKGVLTSHSEQILSTAPSRARRRLAFGDVLISSVRPNLKSHLLFDRREKEWVCSTGFSVVRALPKLLEPAFLFQLMFSDQMDRQIDMLLVGSSYPAINSKDIKGLQIPAPTLDEQRAIAAVLSDMDAEIAALEDKLVKARAVKQGMMQVLLTGEIRLV